MSALNDFVVAAGSYFGLPEGRVMQGSTVDTSNGEMELVLRIVLTTDDVVGIGKRVGVLQTQAQVDAAQAIKRDVVGVPSREELRAQYNSLPDHQRSAFGSFHNYLKAYEQADPYAAPADSPTIPAHVWVPGSELTATQLSMAMSMDADGRYAMDPDSLTEEQRAKWGPK